MTTMNRPHRDRMAALGTAVLAALVLALVAAPNALASEKKKKGGKIAVIFGAGSTDTGNFKEANLFTGTVDTKDTGWFVGGEYRMIRFLGFDLAYVDLGTRSYNGMWTYYVDPITMTPLSAPDEGTIDSTGIRGSVLGFVPLGERFTLLGRVGVLAWDVDEREIFDGMREPDIGKSGTDPLYGAGVRFKVNKVLSLEAGWTQHQDVGREPQTAQTDVDSYSLGAVVSLW